MFINQFPPSLIEAALKILGGHESNKSLFQIGDIVEGSVIKTISPKEALVRIGGVDLFAATETKLLTGQLILGRVDKTSPTVTISLLKGGGADQKAVELLRLLLPSKMPMGDVISRVISRADQTDLPPKIKKAMAVLKQTLSASLQDLDKVTQETIKKGIKNSGLYMEATLKETVTKKSVIVAKMLSAMEGDLKAALGKALKLTEDEIFRMAGNLDKKLAESTKNSDIPKSRSDQPAIAKHALPAKGQSGKLINLNMEMADLTKAREVAKEIKNAINNIELNQLINAPVKRETAGPSLSLFQIPFVQGALIESARVYIQPKDDDAKSGKKKKQGESSIVFMLNMSKLGPVRVDVTVGRNRLNGSVYVLNNTVASFMKENLADLSEKLAGSGYEVWFNVSVADRKKVTEELETHVPITEQGLIDVKA